MNNSPIRPPGCNILVAPFRAMPSHTGYNSPHNSKQSHQTNDVTSLTHQTDPSHTGIQQLPTTKSNPNIIHDARACTLNNQSQHTHFPPVKASHYVQDTEAFHPAKQTLMTYRKRQPSRVSAIIPSHTGHNSSSPLKAWVVLHYPPAATDHGRRPSKHAAHMSASQVLSAKAAAASEGASIFSGS